MFWQDKNILSGGSGGFTGEAEGSEATGSRSKDPELGERLVPAPTLPASTQGHFDSAEIHPGNSVPQVTFSLTISKGSVPFTTDMSPKLV